MSGGFARLRVFDFSIRVFKTDWPGPRSRRRCVVATTVRRRTKSVSGTFALRQFTRLTGSLGVWYGPGMAKKPRRVPRKASVRKAPGRVTSKRKGVSVSETAVADRVPVRTTAKRPSSLIDTVITCWGDRLIRRREFADECIDCICVECVVLASTDGQRALTGRLNRQWP